MKMRQCEESYRIFHHFVQILLCFCCVTAAVASTKEDQVNNITLSELIKSDDDQFDQGQVHHRQRRFITYNLDAGFQVGFLIVIPIIIWLPAMTNLFNKWRNRRSVNDQEDESKVIYRDSALQQPHLDRIATYFELLEIPDRSCQLRAVCEFSADPDKYYPVSDITLSRIRDPNLPPIAYLPEETTGINVVKNATGRMNYPSLFERFVKAADEGQAFGLPRCREEFGKNCKFAMDKLFNMPVLKFWNGLAQMLRFSFADTSAFSMQ